MIEVKNLNKSFKGISVLKNINLTIQDNEIYGLVGPSGVGKSTLLNCLTGLEIYQSGSIAIDGIKLETLSELKMRQFRKNMGMIFQNFSLAEKMLFIILRFLWRVGNILKMRLKIA